MIIGDTHDDYTIIAAIPDGVDAFMCVGRRELSGRMPFFSVIRAWFTGEKQLVYQIQHEGIMVQEVAIVEMCTKAGYELIYAGDGSLEDGCNSDARNALRTRPAS